ncbi:MAG: hypothetical protein AAF151_12000 [Cyanobacteria bacterium J06656_5]
MDHRDDRRATEQWVGVPGFKWDLGMGQDWATVLMGLRSRGYLSLYWACRD